MSVESPLYSQRGPPILETRPSSWHMEKLRLQEPPAFGKSGCVSRAGLDSPTSGPHAICTDFLKISLNSFIEETFISRKFNAFKVHNLELFSYVDNHQHCLILEYFLSLLKETSYPLAVTSHSSLCLSTGSYQSLSVCMDLPVPDTLYRRFIQYVAFCYRLLSHSIMFSKFLHVVICISTSCLFMANIRLYG